MSKDYVPPKCMDCEKYLMPGKPRYKKDGLILCMDCYQNDDPNCLYEKLGPIENRWQILDLDNG